jgi:hypothetical protein
MKVGRSDAYTSDRVRFCVRPEGYKQVLYESLMKDWKRATKEKVSQSAELVVVLEAQGMVRESRSEYDDQASS